MKKLLILLIILISTACNNSEKSNIDTNKIKHDTILQKIISSNKIIDTTKYYLNNAKFNINSVKLNNKAIELYSYVGELPISEKDSILLCKSLFLLNKAIKMDSQYYLAYANKANILCKFKKYTEAINTLNDIIKIRPSYAEGIAYQGFLYEKLGDSINAKKKYNEALESYLNRLNYVNNINDRINVQSDIAFILLFVKGKEKSLELIDSIISINPNNKISIFMKRNILSFDKKEFISNL